MALLSKCLLCKDKDLDSNLSPHIKSQVEGQWDSSVGGGTGSQTWWSDLDPQDQLVKREVAPQSSFSLYDSLHELKTQAEPEFSALPILCMAKFPKSNLEENKHPFNKRSKSMGKRRHLSYLEGHRRLSSGPTRIITWLVMCWPFNEHFGSGWLLKSSQHRQANSRWPKPWRDMYAWGCKGENIKTTLRNIYNDFQYHTNFDFLCMCDTKEVKAKNLNFLSASSQDQQFWDRLEIGTHLGIALENHLMCLDLLIWERQINDICLTRSEEG